MQCIKPVRLDIGTVPCGRCLACRIKKREEWSMRIMHEQHYWEQSVFLTLTYDDEHLPYNIMHDNQLSNWPTLRKDHLQKFFKRLRRYCDAENKTLKYFACGEYGDTTQRPHYHAIIMGLGLDIESKIKIIKAWPYCDWCNNTIRKNSFGLAEPESIRYVAQYIDKKLSGSEEYTTHIQKGREPSLRLCSAGLGRRYAEEYYEQIKSLGYISVKGKKVSIPRYYIKKLDLDTQALKENAYWTDCEKVEKLTGLNTTEIHYCATQGHQAVTKYLRDKDTMHKQYIRNTIARQNLKQSKL